VSLPLQSPVREAPPVIATPADRLENIERKTAGVILELPASVAPIKIGSFSK